jgi:hypothetical protein
VIGEGAEVVIELRLGDIAEVEADVGTRVLSGHDEIVEIVTDDVAVGTETIAAWETETAMTDFADQAETEMIAGTVHVHGLVTDEEVTGHAVATGGTETGTEIGIETETVMEIEIEIVTETGNVTDDMSLARKKRKLGSNSR